MRDLAVIPGESLTTPENLATLATPENPVDVAVMIVGKEPAAVRAAVVAAHDKNRPRNYTKASHALMTGFFISEILSHYFFGHFRSI
jgi:hypothetical protein